MDSKPTPPRPEDVRTVDLATSTTVSFSMIYMMLGLFVGMFSVIPLRAAYPDAWLFGKDGFVIVVVGVAALFFAIPFRIVSRKLNGLRLEFGPADFGFIDRSGDRFRCRYEDLVEVRHVRGATLFTTAQGTFRLPETTFEKSSDGRWFYRLVAPVTVQSKIKISPKHLVAIMIVGLLMLACHPGPLPGDSESIPPLYLARATFAGVGQFVFIVPFSLLGGVFISRVRAKDRQRTNPTYHDFIHTVSPGLKPVELVEGCTYRYVDPKGARSDNDLTVLTFLIGLMAICGVVATLMGRRPIDQAVGVAVTLILCVTTVLLARAARRRVVLYRNLDDRIQVFAEELRVTRKDGAVLFLPRAPAESAKPTLVRSRRPFAWWEDFGGYRIDRRFLFRVD